MSTLNTKEISLVDNNHILPQTLSEETGKDVGSLLVVFRQDQLGSDDKKLGQQLVLAYLEALLQLAIAPQSILFYNTGVRLLTENKKAVSLLRELEKKGCELLACNMSIQHFKLLDKLAVGEISTLEIMLDRQIKADKIFWP